VLGQVVVCPGVEFVPVERDALLADSDLGDVGTDRLVELGTAHPKVGWRQAVAQ
jgi:hypothetical protein